MARLPRHDPYAVFSILALLCALVAFFGGEIRALARDTSAEISYPADREYAEAQDLLKKRDWTQAMITLKKVLQRKRTHLGALTDLSRALVYLGRREEALSMLQRAADDNLPSSQRVFLERRVAALSRSFLSNDTFQKFQEGLTLLIASKLGAAKTRFETALAREPDNVEILLRLGQALILEGDQDTAAERLRFARRLNPSEPEVRLWLGRALYLRGELTEALEELRAARQLLPRSELAPTWLAEAMVTAGQTSAALGMLEQDLRRFPFHLQALGGLAQLRYQAEGRDEATLWNIRRDLQLGISRLNDLDLSRPERFESDLGLDLRRKDELRLKLVSLLSRVESKLNRTSED